MAAYAAAFSLMNTIDRLQYGCTSLDPLSAEIIKPAKEEMGSLISLLGCLDTTRKSKSRKKINALDGRIKEVLWRFEDLLESHVTDQILSQLETNQYLSGRVFSLNLTCLQHDVDSFVREVKCMEEEYEHEGESLPEEEEEEDDERIRVGGTEKTKMIGLSDQFERARDVLIQDPDENHLYGLFGMAGIGKTTLAEKLYEDGQIRRHFEHRVWVNVGRKSRTKEYYARAILAQLDPDNGKDDEREIVEYLKERLEGKKCLVVLDDVWEEEEYNSVTCCLPGKRGITQILLTGRDRSFLDIDYYEVMRFMNEDEGTNLLCKKVFGEEGSLPSHLEKAAKKIAKNCEGLPLLIVAVADRLVSEGDMTEEYWIEVAEKRNSVFTDALDEICKVLFPSYDYLPQILKMLFLSFGVFPPDYEITKSKLINMLKSEGWFLDTCDDKDFESHAQPHLSGLCAKHFLVLFNKSSRYLFWSDNLGRTYKSFRLHCSWQYLCQKEARKIKFYHVLNRLSDTSEEEVNGQRGLCFHNNILPGIIDGIKGSFSTRSLLYLGPYHQYPVPIGFGFKFLRELNALNLRFYTFPSEVLELVLLRFLALTCNGEIPPTISKLIKLRFLIVHPHMSIRHRGAPSYVPVQIWDMQELLHIEILGRSLRVPYHVASSTGLTTLLGVNASISNLLKVCEKFRGMNKLGIQIELTPYDDDVDLLKCFDFISKLSRLEIFKCSIVNPDINRWFLAPPTLNSIEFSYLEKLHLSGMGFPWESMDAFCWCPNLRVIKLRCFAFRGPKWIVKEYSFPCLEFLLIEDSDLEQWTLGPGCFEWLSYLSMKHCYKLQKLHWPSAASSEEIKIELVDCNPLAVTCAKQIQLPKGHALNLTVTSSYGGHNESLKLSW